MISEQHQNITVTTVQGKQVTGRLVEENADRTVTVWEVASGKERARLGKPAAQGQPAGGGGMAFQVVIDGLPAGGDVWPVACWHARFF